MNNLFTDVSDHRVDRKGRVSIPAQIRDALSGSGFRGILVYPSMTSPDAPYYTGCSAERMDRYAEAADLAGPDSEMSQILGEGLFACTERLPFDTEGRVILPATLREHCRITSAVRFVGMGRTFDIWNPELREQTRNPAAARRKVPGFMGEIAKNWRSTSAGEGR